MLTLTEQILLLLVDEDGSFLPLPKGALEHAISGAVLMDLAFAGRIDTDLTTLMVVDATPTGNPMLDRVLERIAARPARTDTRTWIVDLSLDDAPAIREQGADRPRRARPSGAAGSGDFSGFRVPGAFRRPAPGPRMK